MRACVWTAGTFGPTTEKNQNSLRACAQCANHGGPWPGWVLICSSFGFLVGIRLGVGWELRYWSDLGVSQLVLLINGRRGALSEKGWVTESRLMRTACRMGWGGRRALVHGVGSA